MLSNDERRVLREVERHTTIADPLFADALRRGQRRLATPAGMRKRAWWLLALLVLSGALLTLGLLAAAAAVGALAAALACARGYRITAL